MSFKTFQAFAGFRGRKEADQSAEADVVRGAAHVVEPALGVLVAEGDHADLQGPLSVVDDNQNF